MSRVLVEVGCPACGQMLAKVVMEDREVRVRHHEVSLDERPSRPGGVVEVRHWEGSSPIARPEPGKARWTEAACRDVACPGRLVLDDRRVLQLVTEANRLGPPIRWQPGPADVERSEAIRPAGRSASWTEAAPAGLVARAMEVATSEPPPLIEVHRPSRR